MPNDLQSTGMMYVEYKIVDNNESAHNVTAPAVTS